MYYHLLQDLNLNLAPVVATVAHQNEGSLIATQFEIKKRKREREIEILWLDFVAEGRVENNMVETVSTFTFSSCSVWWLFWMWFFSLELLVKQMIKHGELGVFLRV